MEWELFKVLFFYSKIYSYIRTVYRNDMFDSLKDWVYERYATPDSEHVYTTELEGSADRFDLIGTKNDNLELSQNHPILSGFLLFICNLYAQGEFKLEHLDGTLYKAEHEIIDLLNKPNYYQTRIDFLEAFQWLKIVRGSVAIYMKRGIGEDIPDSMYILDVNRIKYPPNFKTPMSWRSKNEANGNQTVIYRETDDPRDNINIRLKDLVFFYDLPNIKTPKNKFISGSRIDGLHQTLQNTTDSLVAKNIILRSNGKEMLSSSGDNGFPLGGDDEEEARRIFNVGYGLSPNRSRAFITNATMKWQSMHIALRDLGLDESTKVDSNIVNATLHIPKDILSLDNKKTTYNNFRESMTSFIQNDMTAMINDFSLGIGIALLPNNIKIVGTYDKLPVMAYLLKEKFEATKLQGEALTLLRNAGVPDEEALEMCGMDPKIKLEDVKQTQTVSGSQGSQAESTNI